MSSYRAILQRAIDVGAFPGAVLHLSRGRKTVCSTAVGDLCYEGDFKTPTTTGTLYDLASLTKIYTLATALCALQEANLAPESTPLSAFLPGFDSRISFEHLFNHTSGLTRHLQTLEKTPADEWVDILTDETLQTEPGRVVLYNCSNYFLLGRALEKLTGQSLDELVARYLLRPLGLENTTFAPCDPEFVAPTEAKRGKEGFWHGVVHDEAARSWRAQTGTCAGNAGLFATASDVARFASIWLLDGHSSPLPGIWRGRAMMNILPEGNAFRGWGWQRDADFFMGTLPPNENAARSFLIGHLGFTGTSLVANPRGGEVAVLLSNRVHPTRLGPDRLPFVKTIHDDFWRSS